VSEYTVDGGGNIEAKIPAEDTGADSVVPKRSVVNEEEEEEKQAPCLLLSIILFPDQLKYKTTSPSNSINHHLAS
jgi:hypothetical protein